MKLCYFFEKLLSFSGKGIVSTIQPPTRIPRIQRWEEDYLVNKIKNQYKDVSEVVIREAVQSCFTVFQSPQTAEKLVQYVVSRLKNIEAEKNN